MDASRTLPCLVLLASLAWVPENAEGQGPPSNRPDRVESSPEWLAAGVSFSAEVGDQIRLFYRQHPVEQARSLPPGIRRNLARGKPLPPGIAKKIVPDGLVTLIHLPPGYEVIEVGLDVLLVEIATNIVHDVLMDVIR